MVDLLGNEDRISFDEGLLKACVSSLHMTPDFSATVLGTYVASVYDNYWSLGKAIETSEEIQDFQVKFMK